MKLKKILHYLNRRDTRLFPHLKPLAKFVLILTIITSTVFLTKNIFASTVEIDITEANQKLIDKENAIEDGNNLEAWGDESLIGTSVSLSRAFKGSATNTGVGWVPGGLIGFTNSSIATLYNPPISGVEYIAHTIDNFLGKPTYAANGFGFDKLNGIMQLWKTLRNAVYTLISLFFIILGIMIMLRIKISPQATISIQVIIPKIVITLILVTFSYAIAGLLIDFSYVFQGIILSLIDSSSTTGAINDNLPGYSVQSLMNIDWTGVHKITSSYFIPSSANTIIRSVSTNLGLIVGIILGLLTPAGLFGLSTVVKAGAGAALGISLGYLLLDIIILIQIIKLFFGLAKCYINILLKIVIAPLEIGLGVFPGSKVNFSSWIVQLIANLIVFPATVIFLLIIIIFINAVQGTGSTGYFWSPNLLANGGVVGAIIGLTGIILLSKIPQIVPEFIFKIKPSPINKLVSDSASGMIHSKRLAGARSHLLESATDKAASAGYIDYDPQTGQASSMTSSHKMLAGIIRGAQRSGLIKARKG